MNVPENLRYTATHEWVRASPTARSRSASPTTRRTRSANWSSWRCRRPAASSMPASACAVVESVKAASDVYAPVAGEVTARNAALGDAPAEVNQDPYAAWLYRLKPARRQQTWTR